MDEHGALRALRHGPPPGDASIAAARAHPDRVEPSYARDSPILRMCYSESRIPFFRNMR
jgi:hypothetical protein